MDPDILEAFEAPPKTNHWLFKSQIKHRSATPQRVMETLHSPTLPVEQQFRERTAYYKYFEEDDIWFRVVLDRDGALRTAFEDDQTMLERGRP